LGINHPFSSLYAKNLSESEWVNHT
jgi:hypothetical protein